MYQFFIIIFGIISILTISLQRLKKWQIVLLLCYIYHRNIPNIIHLGHKAIIIVVNSSIIGFIFKHCKNKCSRISVLFFQKWQSSFDSTILCNLLSVWIIKWIHFHWNWFFFIACSSTVLFNSFWIIFNLTSLCWIILLSQQIDCYQYITYIFSYLWDWGLNLRPMRNPVSFTL